MTVLALRLSRRANAVSALHGEVSRAMWTGLFPGKPEDEVPIGHITNGVHVPSWLAPQMFRLYDRHLGTDWHATRQRSRNLGRNRKRRRRRTVGNSPQPEIAADRIRSADAPSSRPSVAVSRERSLQRLERVLSPDALTIGFARRFATYKRANLILTRHRAPRLDGQRSQPPGAVRVRRQGASAR